MKSVCLPSVSVISNFVSAASWLDGFQLYIGSEMPSVGSPPDTLPSSQLCYTDPMDTSVQAMYDISCELLSGSVVSIMIPDNQKWLTLCEVEVYPGISSCANEADNRFTSHICANVVSKSDIDNINKGHIGH